MHLTLYELAGYAMAAWLLMAFLPTWRVTRWLAESAVFPVYLSVLYVVGITVVLMDTGPGLLGDFGNVQGVLGVLAREDVALIAWIHILAFDQFVGLWIYRDNMRHRYVPIPLQSVLLFFTLMLGPVGFVSYYLLRAGRRALRERTADASLLAVPDPFAPDEPRTGGQVDAATVPAAFAAATPAGVLDDRIAQMPSPLHAPLQYIARVWLREERAITAVGVLGILLSALVLVVAAVRGPVVEPEGVLSKAISFDVAFGIYILTVVLFVPLARFPVRGLRRWRGVFVLLGVQGLAIETIQTLRGLDPRFSRVAGPIDNLVALSFLGFAIATMVMFWILAVRFFDQRRPAGEGVLALAIRYAVLASALAFVAGIVMSSVQGRFLGERDNLLTLHALGFHGLQAAPLIAILAVRGRLAESSARRLVHLAGMLWLGACTLVALQTVLGLSIVDVTVASVGAAVLMLGWIGVAGRAFVRARSVVPGPA